MRLVREIREDYKITTPEDCWKYLKEFAEEDREYFIVLGLDTQCRAMYRDITTIGQLDECSISARNIFKTAIMKTAKSIIVAHNHPTGNGEASEADIQAHRKIAEAGELLGIKMLDCLTITREGVTSFNKAIG